MRNRNNNSFFSMSDWVWISYFIFFLCFPETRNKAKQNKLKIKKEGRNKTTSNLIQLEHFHLEWLKIGKFHLTKLWKMCVFIKHSCLWGKKNHNSSTNLQYSKLDLIYIPWCWLVFCQWLQKGKDQDTIKRIIILVPLHLNCQYTYTIFLLPMVYDPAVTYYLLYSSV